MQRIRDAEKIAQRTTQGERYTLHFKPQLYKKNYTCIGKDVCKEIKMLKKQNELLQETNKAQTMNIQLLYQLLPKEANKKRKMN